MDKRILYKKTSTGAIQTWEIWTENNIIFSASGKLDGKKIPSSDTIRAGKNIGKVNETTPDQQAYIEAAARYVKKLKSGYHETIEGALSGLNHALVGDSVQPMLAKNYSKKNDAAHIVFPCAVQPKLDGIRAIWHKGKLWTRTLKEITSVPHINLFLKEHFAEISLDGELYNHAYKEDFEEIVSIVNQKTTPDPEHEVVQYHVYDVIDTQRSFKDRNFYLKERWEDHIVFESDRCPLKYVDTLKVFQARDIHESREMYLNMGYEGLMLRNLESPYENKRSAHLQKFKVFDDAEFQVVGVKEGRGKLSGHAATFTCVTLKGNEFEAKMKGSTKTLKHYFAFPDEVVGKMLTVQFQGYTNKNNVPRFPIGVRIRSDVD